MRYTTPAIDKDIVESMSKILQEQVIPKGIELNKATISELSEESNEPEVEQIDEAITIKVRDPYAGSGAHPDGDYHIKDGKKVGETPAGHHIIKGKLHYPRTGGGGGHKHRLFIVDKDHKKVLHSHKTNDEKEHKEAVNFAKNNHSNHWVHGRYNGAHKDWAYHGEPILSSEKTKAAKKPVNEEVEQIDEAFFNHRTAGSHGIIHRDSAARFYKTGEHVDFYDHGTGDKQHGKVTKNDGKEVHILHAGKTKKYKLSNTYPGHGVTEQLDLEETQQIDEALSPDNPVSRATADLHAALQKAAEKAAKLFDVSKGAAYTLLKAHGSNAPGNIDPSRYKESFRGEEEYRAMIKFTSGVELKVQPAIEQAVEQLRALSKKL